MRKSTFEYSSGSEEFTEKLVECLKNVKKVFNEYEIPYWLEYGTLLGIVRDEQILPWDDDFDVGIWIENMVDVAKTKKRFAELGYILYINPKHGHYQLACKKHGEHLGCILAFYKHKGYITKVHFNPVFRGSALLNNIRHSNIIMIPLLKLFIKMRLYNNSFITGPCWCMDNFATVKAYDMKFPIPENADVYLKFMYGKDWQTPKRDNIDDGHRRKKMMAEDIRHA